MPVRKKTPKPSRTPTRGFWYSLQGTGQLLVQHPKILLPKLIVAALYGLLLIWTAQNVRLLLGPGSLPISSAQGLVQFAVVSLGLSLLAIVIDVLVNAMYSVLVQDLRAGRKLSLGRAFGAALERSPGIIPMNILVLFAFAIAVIPFLLVILLSQAYTGWISALIFGGGLMGLGLVVLYVFIGFYLANPIMVIEKRGITETLKHSLRMARDNMKEISMVSIASILISLLSIVLAFSIGNITQPGLYGLAFVLSRLVTVILYTYQYSLVPVFYFDIKDSH